MKFLNKIFIVSVCAASALHAVPTAKPALPNPLDQQPCMALLAAAARNGARQIKVGTVYVAVGAKNRAVFAYQTLLDAQATQGGRVTCAVTGAALLVAAYAAPARK